MRPLALAQTHLQCWVALWIWHVDFLPLTLLELQAVPVGPLLAGQRQHGVLSGLVFPSRPRLGGMRWSGACSLSLMGSQACLAVKAGQGGWSWLACVSGKPDLTLALVMGTCLLSASVSAKGKPLEWIT